MTLTWQSGAKKGSIAPARLLSWGTSQLGEVHESRSLLQWATGVDSLLSLDRVGYRAAERFRSAVAQRRRGFPLQHIMGSMQFRGFELDAGPGVFCVRPETEMLVEYALEIPGVTRALDLCAGSGAIGIALALEGGYTVDAVEVSPVAASYAKRNYAKTGADVNLIVGDALTHPLPGDYDLVVSNPPYVPGEPHLSGDVLFDPEIALYGGGEDGMVLPRGIITRAAAMLRRGGYLLMEHAEIQASLLANFAESVGFEQVKTLNDLTGRPRFLSARKPLESDL